MWDKSSRLLLLYEIVDGVYECAGVLAEDEDANGIYDQTALPLCRIDDESSELSRLCRSSFEREDLCDLRSFLSTLGSAPAISRRDSKADELP